MGEHDPGRGRVRPDGRRRDALAVLRAAARPQPALRVRPGARDQAEAPDLLALGQVPHRLREHRGLRAVLGPARARRRPAAARPVARRAHEAARRRRDRGVRGDADRRRDARVRRVRRRRLELVHPPLAAALLLLRRGRLPHALVRPRPGGARDRARDAVPVRPPVAEPRPGRPGVGAPRALARARRARPGAARRDRRGAARRRARPPGARRLPAEAPAAAAPAHRRRCLARGRPCRRDRRGAARQGGRRSATSRRRSCA